MRRKLRLDFRREGWPQQCVSVGDSFSHVSPYEKANFTVPTPILWRVKSYFTEIKSMDHKMKLMDHFREGCCHWQDCNMCTYSNSLENQLEIFVVVHWKPPMLGEGSMLCKVLSTPLIFQRFFFSFRWNSTNIKPLPSASWDAVKMQLTIQLWAAFLRSWSPLRWHESGNNSCNQ